MYLNFKPLNESHFPLLLKWLEGHHVKKWWDKEVAYTLDLIKQKYLSYTKGFKQVNGINKSIQGFIIYVNQQPIGYIQIYNAYDFPRSKSLTGLPQNLGAFDIFIGEEQYLGIGLAPKIINKFLSLYGNSYAHIFADPDIDNIPAIKAYEKAGFKKISEHQENNDLWMLWQRPDALATIQKLIKERYKDATAVFWSGSVLRQQPTASSDLDLVIIYESLKDAYREAFIYDSWPIDAFIHDHNSLCYFFNESKSDGIAALAYMILEGQEILDDNNFAKNIKYLVQKSLDQNPLPWDKERIDKERFFITDIFEDIKFPQSHFQQITSAARLFEQLIQFYFRAQNKWSASGKSLIRFLENDNMDLSLEFHDSFECVFKTGETTKLENLIEKILFPYGGLLWDGFHLAASIECKKINK